MSGVKYYPYYHAAPTPKATSLPWINDPEGAVWDEEAKLFRAWAIFSATYPVDSFDSDWLEFTSPDGLLWTPGDIRMAAHDFNGGGLWGGAVIIDTDNTAGFGKNAVIYLVTAAMNEPNSDQPFQAVSRWVAPRLGVNPRFVDYPICNPNDSSIDSGKDFRDSRVFWDQKSKRWVLAISVSYGIQFYGSKDTKTWEFLSVWVAPGRTYGQAGGVECPNLVFMPLDESDSNGFACDGEGDPAGKWVLFFSDQNPPRETVRAVFGEWDGTKFVPDADGNVVDLDYGPDFYAQSVYQKDGEFFMLGWLGNWKYAFTSPMVGYKNYLIMPRKLTLRRRGGWYEIHSAPLPGIDKLFTTEGSYTADRRIIGGQHHSLPLDDVKTTEAFKLKLRLKAVNGRWPSNINLNVRTNGNVYTQLFLLADRGTAEVYRAHSGAGPGDGREQWEQPISAPVDFSTGTMEVVAYVDSASVEYFLQDNDVVITAQTFPLDTAFGVTLTASEDGLCLVEELTILPFKETLRPSASEVQAIEQGN